jgi:hypothetical protein
MTAGYGNISDHIGMFNAATCYYLSQFRLVLLLVIDKLFHTELYGEHNELDIIRSWSLKKSRETVKESKITNVRRRTDTSQARRNVNAKDKSKL